MTDVSEAACAFYSFLVTTWTTLASAHGVGSNAGAAAIVFSCLQRLHDGAGFIVPDVFHLACRRGDREDRGARLLIRHGVAARGRFWRLLVDPYVPMLWWFQRMGHALLAHISCWACVCVCEATATDPVGDAPRQGADLALRSADVHSSDALKDSPQKIARLLKEVRSSSLRDVKLDIWDTIFAHHWKRGALRPCQRAALARVLSGADTLCVLPTGSGKSALYMLPNAFGSGVAVVIQPLLALMQEQMNQLEDMGVLAGHLHSRLSRHKETSILDDLSAGRLRFHFLSAERLVGALRKGLRLATILRSLDNRKKLNMFVLDEAHLVCSWGNGFRPSFRRLSNLKKEFPTVQCVALTGTATEDEISDMAASLEMAHGWCKLVVGVGRPNLKLVVALDQVATAKRKLVLALMGFDAKVDAKPLLPRTIVYVRERRKCEALANAFAPLLGAQAYHAKLPDSVKRKVEDAWRSGSCRFLCATVAWGLGMDCPDVRCLCIWDAPEDFSAFWQLAGRAGRDGSPATVLTFASSVAEGNICKQQRQKRGGLWVKASTSRIALARMLLGADICRHAAVGSFFASANSTTAEVCGHMCDVCEAGLLRGLTSVVKMPGRKGGEPVVAQQVLEATKTGRAAERRNERGAKKSCAAAQCPACSYALQRKHGRRGPFRQCSRRGQGCQYTRDLSPEGLAAAPAWFRENCARVRPAGTFFTMARARKRARR